MAKFWRNKLQKKKRIGKKNFNWEAMTAICSFFLTLSVVIALLQFHLSKNVANVDSLTKLDEEFNSERIEKAREITVALDFTNPDANELVQCEPVLDFFEKMAYLEEQKAISLDAVDTYWGYWIERYWVLCEKFVYKLRAENPDDGCYEGFETLFNKLVTKLPYKKKEVTNRELEIYKNKIKKELEEFKKEETKCCNLCINTPQLSGRMNVALDGKR
jgi:hypothetical protein